MSQLIIDFAQSLKTLMPTAVVRPALGKDYTYPAVIYYARNGQRDLFYTGSYGLAATEFVVSIYAKSYVELQALKVTVVDNYHGYSGELGESVIGKAEVIAVLDGFDDDLETVFKTIITINVLN